MVDLTYGFGPDTIYWPTEEGFVLERGANDETRGYHYEANRFRAAEHGGTHLDAPAHFHEDRRHVDDLLLDDLVGAAVMVDLAGPCAEDPDHAITKDDLERWESRHGRISPGSIVLLRTGFGRVFTDRERYLGTALRGPAAVADLHFPGLSPLAAQWLIEERQIKAVGIDTASIDPGQSRYFKAHQLLGGGEVPVFENVANLDLLPARGFHVIALPMKIEGGSGAPLRIIAVMDN